jgi:hypothetical protein
VTVRHVRSFSGSYQDEERILTSVTGSTFAMSAGVGVHARALTGFELNGGGGGGGNEIG